MTTECYPVGADTGFSEKGEINSELDRLLWSLGERLQDFVADPFNGNDFGLTTSGSSYDVDIAPGVAFLNGHIFRSDATETVTVDANATNELFIIVEDSKTNNASFEYTSDGSTPANKYAMKIWEITTDGSGVTGTTDTRPFAPFHLTGIEKNAYGRQVGSETFAVDSKTVLTTTVNIPNPYPNALDEVLLQITARDQTDFKLAYAPTVLGSSMSPDSFDIEVNVSAASSTGGASIDVGWQAFGH